MAKAKASDWSQSQTLEGSANRRSLPSISQKGLTSINPSMPPSAKTSSKHGPSLIPILRYNSRKWLESLKAKGRNASAGAASAGQSVGGRGAL